MGELLEFVKRENEIFRILKRLVEKELDVIVVGGYAVSGLARHRFSVDCDLVVPKRELRNLEELLEKEGFDDLKDVTKVLDSFEGIPKK